MFHVEYYFDSVQQFFRIKYLFSDFTFIHILIFESFFFSVADFSFSDSKKLFFQFQILFFQVSHCQ